MDTCGLFLKSMLMPIFTPTLHSSLWRPLALGVLLFGTLPGLGLTHTYADESAPETIKREEVLSSLATQRSDWDAKIHSRSPRLFFSAQEWPQVQKGILSLTPKRKALADAFFSRMDSLLDKPLPTYLPPEKRFGQPGYPENLFVANEELWQRDVGSDIFALALAARLRPEAPYRAKMHDLVMTAIGYDTWGRSNNPRMGNNSDLVMGHLARGIATAYDWHRDTFTEEERQQIRTVIAERLPCLLQGLYGRAFWAQGFEENHNQVSVLALATCGLVFYDEIPEAPEWLAAARLNYQAVGRHMPADGSSVEGVSYWNYGLSYILQYIEATRAVLDSADLYQLPFLKNAASYRLMAATSDLVGNLPWGDCVFRGWSTPHGLIYRLASEYNDPTAAWFADHLPPPRGTSDDFALNLLWAHNAPLGTTPPKTLDARLFANDLVSSRSGWNATDYLLSIKGGFTNRNHSHLDAGALALAFGDEWLLIAPGYGSGSGQRDFWSSSGPRWTFFSNATESHSTLLINGKNQRFDRGARATITQFFSTPDWNWNSFDLTRAYADVQAVTRSILHRRGRYILVFDSVNADQPVTAEWLAQLRHQPSAEENNTLLSVGKNGRLRLRMLTPAVPFTPRQPTSPKVDVKLPTHHTYAVSTTGPAIRFLALLQPVGADQNTPALTVKEESSSPDGNRLVISGEGWTDHIARADHAKEFSFPLPSVKAPATITETLAVAQRFFFKLVGRNTDLATITGTLAVVQTFASEVEGFLALGATSVTLPGFSYQSPIPCNLAARKTADGWNVTASRNIQDAIQIESKKNLNFTIAKDSR